MATILDLCVEEQVWCRPELLLCTNILQDISATDSPVKCKTETAGSLESVQLFVHFLIYSMILSGLLLVSTCVEFSYSATKLMFLLSLKQLSW